MAEAAAAPPPAAPPKPKWVPRVRDYVIENKAIAAELKPTKYHPLLPEKPGAPGSKKAAAEPTKAAAVPASKPKAPADDPLSMFAGSAARSPLDDPLSAMAMGAPSSSPTAAAVSKPNAVAVPDIVKKNQDFEAWPLKTDRILTKYTTSKTISVTANFLEEKEENGNKEVDQVKSRLEQLEIDEDTQEGKSMMTQKEYIAHMEEQHSKLKEAWETDERVVSLKIAIQCAKLLGDTSVPQFYPSMYVLLTTVLDTFGELVYQRIKSRGTDNVNPNAPGLPAEFKATDVSASAKETCRNWFFKTACIRELMPRMYIDMALIKSYRFLDETNFSQIFARVSRSIRGLGDPLAASYARAYVCTKINDIASSYKENDPLIYNTPPRDHRKSLLEAFDDFMFQFKALKKDNFKAVKHVEQNLITEDEYIDLFQPALDWIVQNVGYSATEELFFALSQQYRDYCNNSAVLIHILAKFPKKFISNHAQSMVTLIKEADENSKIKKSALYLTLGLALIESPPPKAQRLPILNDVWKVVTKIEDPEEYIEIAVVFVQYMLINFSEKEVNIFLKDVIKHVKKGGAHLKLQEQIQKIVVKTVELTSDIEATLAMDNFLPVIDLLETAAKVPAAKTILMAFAKDHIKPTADPVIIHTLFDVARSLHDSIDSMSFIDEKRQISRLIVSVIRKVDYGRDLEKQLTFYVDGRQAFTALDDVTRELVLRVALLAMRAHKFMKGKHTRKTAAFVKACLAYCHITIPSLEETFARLHLLLELSEVALVNGMIVQAEALCTAAIRLIPDVPAKAEDPVTKKISSTESELVSFVSNFASFLLFFPGHPAKGPFFLVSSLMQKAINVYEPWQQPGSLGKAKVYVGLLSLFATYYQPNFPTHIDKIESNDSLYGGDPEYKAQVLQFCDEIVAFLWKQLEDIGAKGDVISKKNQGTLALDVVNLMVSFMEINNQSATLIVKLYQMAKSGGAVAPSYIKSTEDHIAELKGQWGANILQKLNSPPI